MAAVISNGLYQAKASSGIGILSYLEEDNVQLQAQVLQRLYACVDIHWAEICGHLPTIESISEDEHHPANTLAAALASKCYFHLQEYSECLRLALCAGTYVNVSDHTEYIDVLLTTCIDEYKALRAKQEQESTSTSADKDKATVIDARIEAIIEQMFQRCYADKCFEQALGVALDTYRIDKVDEVCSRALASHNNHSNSSNAAASASAVSSGGHDFLNYAFQLCSNTHTRAIQSRRFRLSVLEVLVKQYSTLAHPDYTHMCVALQTLNQPVEVAILLRALCVSVSATDDDKEFLQACQIAFELQECENQGFVLKIVAALQSFDTTSSPSGPAPGSAGDNTSSATTDVPSSSSSSILAQTHTRLAPITDNELYTKRLNQLKRILLESFDVDLYLNFLYTQNHADISVLQTVKQIISGGPPAAAAAAAKEKEGAAAGAGGGAAGAGGAANPLAALLGGGGAGGAGAPQQHTNSVLHNATVCAHGFMYAGTTVDTFLRDNLDWLGKATNWNKFTAVASIGVVHKGHIHESMNLLQPYLPQAGQSASPYSEAGALYALGMIHANKGGSGDSTTITYLTDALKNAGVNEVVQHGACLGIGLAAMATGDSDIFENLRQVLFTDNAVAGEGAALAIGLLMLGQADSAMAEIEIPNLLNAAHDSPHEKIVRALSLSIAMFVYGKEEGADVIIEQLLRDRDPIVRYGGVYAVGMAYIGTSDNNAIRKLLHVAVSDVSDDVRRAAVSVIGIVCFRSPADTVPKLVSLLAESFNPHMRYGACMAVGIACAGSVCREAIELLFPMIEDEVDFVRQGALIGLALVLQQASDARTPSVKKFRETCVAMIGDKYQTYLSKSGAILALGILDAGGRNVVFSLSSRSGFVKMGSAVGIMMFLQNWYWYPTLHFLSLCFSPTVLIGLNKDLDMPTNFSVVCNTPPSMFAYPKTEEKKDDNKKHVATAVLSTTAKAKLREARKEARKGRPGTGAVTPGSALGPPASPSLQRTHSVDGSESARGAPDAPALEKVNSLMSNASYLSIEEIKPAGAPADDSKPAKKEKEPSHFVVQNPSRVVPAQVRYLSLTRAAYAGSNADRAGREGLLSPREVASPRETDAMDVDQPGPAVSFASASGKDTKESSAQQQQRYLPVDVSRRKSPYGIVMLMDNAPAGSAPDTAVTRVARMGLTGAAEEEAEPPADFEWDPNSD